MATLNKVMLIGNIGKDPEFRMGQQSGTKCVNFSLATTKRYKDASGEQKEETTWHNIVGWGKIADIFEQLGVRKGTSIYVEGSLSNRSWTDQNGQKRSATDVKMETFQLLTPRGQGAQQPGSVFGQGVAQDYQQGMDQQAQQAYAAGSDDDLPF